MEGEAYEMFACGRFNGCDYQILTTNTKNARGSITKGKLAFEVAKLVKRNIEGIKVSAEFCPRAQCLTPNRAGSNWLWGCDVRERSIDQALPRLEVVLAARSLVRG